MAIKRALMVGVMGLCALTGAWAQQDFSKVEISTQKVADGIYMLQGRGGNIGVSVGEDGVFIIDDQYAPLTDKIKKALATLSDKPVRFVLNTHYHGDHTGGNENLGKGGAIIVAHDNVRKRLAAGQFIKAFNTTMPPAPAKALPVVTFSSEVTFHWNNQTLAVKHIAPAHTDGDAVIFFEDANVLHTGDLYFNGFYPFIDANAGGSLKGMIDGVNKLLASINDQTKVIPGHGPLSNKAELKAFRDMLATVHARLLALTAAGKSVEEIIASKPIADLEAEWGDGFLPTDTWLRIVLDGM